VWPFEESLRVQHGGSYFYSLVVMYRPLLFLTLLCHRKDEQDLQREVMSCVNCNISMEQTEFTESHEERRENKRRTERAS